jgi:hypothetical protein
MMNRSGSQSDLWRFSLFDPLPLTLVVYGGLVLIYFFGDLGGPIGRLLLIPGLLGLVMVPIFTSRSIGQVVMASFAGSRMLWLTSGPLMLRREDEQLRLGLNDRWRRYSGRVLIVPEEGADLRKWAALRDTGSVVGIAVYIVLMLFVVSPVLQSLPGIAGDPDRVRLAATSTFGLSVLVATVGIWNLVNHQGPRIWRMLRRGKPADRQAALIALTAMGLGGIRPRDWPAEWVQAGTWDDDGTLEGVYGQRFGYLHALDRGDLESADRYFSWMEEHAGRMRGRLRQQVVDMERPFVEAWVRGDATAAREALDGIDPMMTERHRLRRIEASVLLAEGDYQAARQQAVDGLNAIQHKLEDGEAIWEASVLDEILARTGSGVDEAETVSSAP